MTFLVDKVNDHRKTEPMKKKIIFELEFKSMAREEQANSVSFEEDCVHREMSFNCSLWSMFGFCVSFLSLLSALKNHR